MNEEELFCKLFPEYVVNGKPLSPYFDLFESGYEQSEKRIEDIENKLANVSYQLEGREVELKELQEDLEDTNILYRNSEKEKCELLGIIQSKDKVIKKLQEQIEKMKSDVKAIHLKNDFTKSPYQNMVDEAKAISEVIKYWSQNNN